MTTRSTRARDLAWALSGLWGRREAAVPDPYRSADGRCGLRTGRGGIPAIYGSNHHLNEYINHDATYDRQPDYAARFGGSGKSRAGKHHCPEHGGTGPPTCSGHDAGCWPLFIAVPRRHRPRAATGIRPCLEGVRPEPIRRIEGGDRPVDRLRRRAGRRAVSVTMPALGGCVTPGTTAPAQPRGGTQ